MKTEVPYNDEDRDVNENRICIADFDDDIDDDGDDDGDDDIDDDGDGENEGS